MSDLVTAKELADLLSLRLEAVWQYTREGRIPAFRVGRSYRYDPDEVLATLRHSEVTKVDQDQDRYDQGRVREVKAAYEAKALSLPDPQAARDLVGHARIDSADMSARISHYMYESLLQRDPRHGKKGDEQ